MHPPEKSNQNFKLPLDVLLMRQGIHSPEKPDQKFKLPLDVLLMRQGIHSPEKPSVLNKLLLDLLLPLLDLPPVYPTKPKMKLTIGDKVMQVFSDDLGKPVKPPKQNI
jgi:hypothetical protein